MKLQILSDLHLEFNNYDWNIPILNSSLVILAGDIGVGIKSPRWAIEQSKKLNKEIILIFGNHSYYNQYYENLKIQTKEMCQGTEVYFLDNNSIIINGIRFLGTTLWSNFRGLGDQYIEEAKQDAARWITDYRLIHYKDRLITPNDTEKFYFEAVDWLYNELAKPFKGKTVLIVHHGPSPKCHNDQRHGLPNPLSTYFWSDLEDLIIPNKIDLVIYGHTHSNLRFQVNGVPVVTNQKGYRGENNQSTEDFNINYVVEV